MNITLLTVGRTDRNWIMDGVEAYRTRLRHYTSFSMVEIPELRNVSALTRDQIKTREGQAILKSIREGDEVILLDEHGKEYSSTGFAQMIQTRMVYGGRDLVFIIGGAYGFSKEVYDRASSMISLSRMTFSHQMVRPIFIEQLYRAFTIIKGEPYHHE